MLEIINQEKIQISSIIRDEKLQPRVAMDKATIEEYATAIKNGDKLPPVTIFYDGTKYWLSDGWHRLEAAISAGQTDISAEIRRGSYEDALKYSLSANATHGLKRSQADKKRAIINALNAFPLESSRRIARLVHVDDKTVGKYREELELERNEVNEMILGLLNQHECIIGFDRYKDQRMAAFVNIDEECFWFEHVNFESGIIAYTKGGLTRDKDGFTALKFMLMGKFELSNFDWFPHDEIAEEYRKMGAEIRTKDILGIADNT